MIELLRYLAQNLKKEQLYELAMFLTDNPEIIDQETLLHIINETNQFKIMDSFTKDMPEKLNEKHNDMIDRLLKKNNVDILVTKNPSEAAKDVDCVMTDKWISMNDKVNKKAKKNSLKKYQVNKKLMKLAKSDAIFMHCLPVGRGEEVTDEVIDGKQSVVWRQALNRVHAQKSIINWCLN